MALQPPKLGSRNSSSPVGDAVDRIRRGSRGAAEDARALVGQPSRLPASEHDLPTFGYDTSAPPLLKVSRPKSVSGTTVMPGGDKNAISLTGQPQAAAKQAEVSAATPASAATSSSYTPSVPLKGLDSFDAKVIGPAQTAVGIAGLAPLALGAVNLAGKVLAAPFGWVGAKGIADKIRTAAGKPTEYANRSIEEVMGERVSRAGSSVIGAFEKPLDSLGEVTGYNSYRLRKYAAKTERSLGKMGDAASRLERAASEAGAHLDSSLQGHVRTLTSAVGRQASALETAAMAEASSALEAAYKSNSALKYVSKHATEVHNAAVLAGEHAASTVSLGASAKSMASGFGKGSFMNGATNAAFIGMDGISLYQTGRGFQHDMDSFAQLCVDMKAVKGKPSLAKLAFMELPPSLATVRSELFKQYASQFGVRALGAAINLRGIMKGRFNQWLWGAQFAGSMAIDGLVSGRGLLATYAPLNEAFKAGHALGVDDYATLLTAGCKDCMDRKEGIKNPVIHELAERLSKQKVSPAEILRMSDSGEIGKMIAQITTAATETTALDDSSGVSFVQRVGGPNQKLAHAASVQPSAALAPKAAASSFSARETLKPDVTTVPSIG